MFKLTLTPQDKETRNSARRGELREPRCFRFDALPKLVCCRRATFSVTECAVIKLIKDVVCRLFSLKTDVY